MNDYFEALNRLKEGKPNVVDKGTRITNDAVALEAGRGKGSIKKSRPVFTELIAAIDEAARIQALSRHAQKVKLDKAKSLADEYLGKWESALCRELCLLRELAELKKKLAKLTGENVLPIRAGRPDEHNASST